MKKMNFIKIGLDILMVIVFVLLFNKMAVVPMTFHEIAGLFLGVAFIIHIVLNFKWVKQVTLKLFDRKINLRTKFGYIIDVLLLVCFIIAIITGILMSKVVFPNFRVNSSINFKMIHISISYIALLLVGIHIGLHWNWIVNVLKNIFGITGKSQILGVIAKFIVILIFIFGLYNIYSVQYFSKVSSITMSVSNSEGQPKQQSSQNEGNSGGKNEGHPTQGGAQNEGHSGEPNVTNSPNIFGIISTYMSIISVFSIITFYLEKLLVKRRLS